MAMLTDRLLNYLVKSKMTNKKSSALLRMSQAKTIVLLVQLDDELMPLQLSNNEFTNRFEGKNVWIIGLNLNKERVQIAGLPANMHYIELQRKDFNFLGWPKRKLDKKIPAIRPELIMNFDHTADLRLTYIASLMPAGFMIGLGQANPNSYYDLTLAIDKASNLKETFEQFCKYLDLLYGHDKA
jgi:hypothetical protein